MKVLNNYGLRIISFKLKGDKENIGQFPVTFSMIWKLFKYHFKHGQTKVMVSPIADDEFNVDFIFYRYIKTKENKTIQY